MPFSCRSMTAKAPLRPAPPRDAGGRSARASAHACGKSRPIPLFTGDRLHLKAKGSGYTTHRDTTFAALTDEFLPPGELAVRAGLSTRNRRELTTQACCALVRLGLAGWHYDGRW